MLTIHHKLYEKIKTRVKLTLIVGCMPLPISKKDWYKLFPELCESYAGKENKTQRCISKVSDMIKDAAD